MKPQLLKKNTPPPEKEKGINYFVSDVPKLKSTIREKSNWIWKKFLKLKKVVL